MIDIQDEAYSEAMDEIKKLKRINVELSTRDNERVAEIERLKELVESWKGGHSIAALDRDLAKDRIKRLEEALQRQDNEIIDLKALVTRAADALDEAEWRHGEYMPLIDELRKAAE